MQRLLFALLLCGSFGLMAASPTISSDLLAISSLSQDFKKYSPKVARRAAQATCAMVTECCPQMKSRFAPMALRGEVDRFQEQCFDGKQSLNTLKNLFACSPLMQLTVMVANGDILRYMLTIKTNLAHDQELKKLMVDTCTEKELYAMVCNWNQSEEELACRRKVLEKWAAQGDEVYAKKVQEVKDNYAKMINALKKAFPQ